MADAPPPVVSADVPGFWSASFEQWSERLLWLMGIVGVLFIVFRYIIPIIATVPLGTWVWRLVMIGAIAYGSYQAGKMWYKYIQINNISNMKWALLYVRLPRSAPRSIYTMEMVLDSLHDGGGTGTWRHLFWDGAVRKYATLEIVSVEGKIYYFFRVLTGVVDFLKTQIYAQFPEAEVTEVDDYVKYVPPYSASNKEWVMNGFEIKYTRETEQLFPIKTYIDYGLDKPGEPTERINPLANMLEVLGALGPGEQYWIQIHIRAAAARFSVKGSPKKQDWKKEYAGNLKTFEEEIQKTVQSGLAADVEFGKKRVTEYMTDYEKKLYDAIQRKTSKRMFDVGMRCIYIAKKEMSKGFAHGAVEGVLKQFSAPGLNGLESMNATLFAPHPWDNVMDSGGAARRENLYNAYIQRSYFYPPYNSWVDKSTRKIMLMTAEELATLFHFPGEEVTTGGLSRVEARKAEAPANLPIS